MRVRKPRRLVLAVVRAATVWAVAAVSAAGCRVPVGIETVPGTAPRCDRGVCLEVVSFLTHRPTVGVWIEAPPDTWLVNARMTPDEGPLCQGRFAVEWVMLDAEL